MRTFSSSVTTQVVAKESIPRRLFRLHLDGGLQGYTDHTSDLLFQGVTYHARKAAHSPINTYMGKQADSCGITLDNVDGELTDYMAYEKFEGRIADIWQVYLSSQLGIIDGLAVTPTFARASVAYDPDDASQVANDVPRYVIGADGMANGAIVMEEGTTNLFPDASALSFGAPWTSGVLNGTYAVSIRGGTGTLVLTGGATGSVAVGASLIIAVSSATVTFTPTAGTPTYCQLELKAYSTSWQRPSVGARAAETLTVPVAGLLTQAGPWTITFRYNPLSPPVSGSGRYLFEWRSTGGSTNRYYIWMEGTGKIYAVAVSGGAEYYPTISGVLTQNIYHQITMVNDGAKIYLYFNGAATGTGASFAAPIGSMNANCYLGSNSVNTGQCDGVLDDVQFFNRALTSTEIAALYALGAPSPETPETTAMIRFNSALTSDDKIVQFSGVMGQPADDKNFTVTVRNTMDRPKSMSPHRFWGMRCNEKFCGPAPGCGYNGGVKVSGTASSGSTTSLTSAALVGVASMIGGRLVILGGANMAYWRTIKTHNTGTGVITFTALPVAIDNTSVFLIDCDKMRTTCEGFGNQVHFDGYDEKAHIWRYTR